MTYNRVQVVSYLHVHVQLYKYYAITYGVPKCIINTEENIKINLLFIFFCRMLYL